MLHTYKQITEIFRLYMYKLIIKITEVIQDVNLIKLVQNVIYCKKWKILFGSNIEP